MNVESLITVVSVRSINPRLAPANLIYIGRRVGNWPQSPLANLVKLTDESQRDALVNQYGIWFWEKIGRGDRLVIAEIERIANMVRNGQAVMLGCWCKRPGLYNLTIDAGEDKACHGDVIKQAVIWWIVNKCEVAA
jgi:Domain of unknown function (DUF4326)